MIAVLQPAGGVAANRLQMRRRIGGIAHLGIGRRNRHFVQAADRADVADRGAIGAHKRITLAALDAADGQLILDAKLQPQLFGKAFHAARVNRRQGHLASAPDGPDRLQVLLNGLLIHHDVRRLAPEIPGNAAISLLVPARGFIGQAL
jgi:hypothetical protein